MTSTAQLDALIDELTVDAYGDEEQLTGFLTGAEEALRRGEPARIVGVDVAVFAVDVGPDARSGLTARVARGDTTYEVGLAYLVFSAGQPAWSRGGCLLSLAGARATLVRRVRPWTRSGHQLGSNFDASGS
jgi:hypothetical protein